MKACSGMPTPHPALRATFSRREKGIRRASLRDFHAKLTVIDDVLIVSFKEL
jgi:hypothetical protein